MSVQNIKEKIGDYAKDVRVNIGNVLSEEGSPELHVTQILGTALASAYATKNADLIQNIESLAAESISAEEIQAAKSAAAIMGMNNVYYRFVHLVSDAEFKTIPAGLRMQVIGNPGVEKVHFELYSLAVSAINGCGMCIDAHVNQLIKAGLSKKAIQSSIRIASVIASAAQAIEIEKISVVGQAA